MNGWDGNPGPLTRTCRPDPRKQSSHNRAHPCIPTRPTTFKAGSYPGVLDQRWAGDIFYTEGFSSWPECVGASGFQALRVMILGQGRPWA